MDKPLFSVEVLTYNHAEYIAETLDSIISQEHPYPYEIIIGDDCSVDNTRNILLQYKKKYPDIITLILNKKNMGLIGNYFNVLSHTRGKYLMGCGGDDYWLPGKVTLQIAFMEKHPEIGMCYGKLKEYDQAKKYFVDIRGGPKTEFLPLVEKNCIPALTACMRRDVLSNYLKEMDPANKSWHVEDYPMWLWFTFRSKIYFFDEILGIYRCVMGSVSHKETINEKIEFELGINAIRSFYCDYFSVPFDTKYLENEIYRDCLKEAIIKLDEKAIQEIVSKIRITTLKDRILVLSRFRLICYVLCFLYFIKNAKQRKKIKNYNHK
jgi:glycosyltransferase involved in cell wall biosynthesis